MGQTLESLSRVTTPPPAFLLSSPSLSLAHFPHLNQRDYETKWSLKLNCHSNIAPTRKAFKTSIFPSGVVPGHQPTCLPNRICMESTTTEGAQVPTGGDQRYWRLKTKTTETESRSPLATVYACTASWWSVPGKILDANQSN